MSIGLAGAIIAGLVVGIAFVGLFAFAYYVAPPSARYLSLYDAIEDDLSKVSINKATMEIRTVSDFPPTTGPGLCIAKIGEQISSSTMRLATILADADRSEGESVTHRLSPEELIPMAKHLCVNEGWLMRNEDKNMQWYPGRIATDGGGKYWYSIQVFWNLTQENSLKETDENFDGRMPLHDKLKVYIFPSDELYFEEDLLSHIQNEVVLFEVASDDYKAFGASPLGIYNLEDYLVVPGGVEFYIDKEFRKPDGSSIAIADLHPSASFGNGFSDGVIGVLYDYEYVQVPTIWFVVDADLYADDIDSHVDEIRSLLKSHISECLELRKTLNPHEADAPCP